MRQLQKRLGPYVTVADVVLFLGILAVSVAGVPVAGFRYASSSEAVVRIEGKPVYVLRFAHDETVRLDAPLGPVKIELRRGKIRIVESSCQDKFCVAQRPITPLGGAIVCAPNKLVIEVRRRRVGEIDCVTQ